MTCRYPVFVITWWITGTMAIACYTAAFVWTMEMCSGKWKIYLGMSMNYSWPVSRLIIAGLAYCLRDWHWHLRCKIFSPSDQTIDKLVKNSSSCIGPELVSLRIPKINSLSIDSCGNA